MIATPYISFRVLPSLTYSTGPAVNYPIAAYIFPTSNFGDSSWSRLAPAAIEATTGVADIMQGLSKNNPFIIDSMRINLPEGIDSPVTLPKLGINVYFMLGLQTGKARQVRINFTNLYKQFQEQDRIFDFPLNLLYNQYAAFRFETDPFLANWAADTFATVEFTIRAIQEKNTYVS